MSLLICQILMSVQAYHAKTMAHASTRSISIDVSVQLDGLEQTVNRVRLVKSFCLKPKRAFLMGIMELINDMLVPIDYNDYIEMNCIFIL